VRSPTDRCRPARTRLPQKLAKNLPNSERPAPCPVPPLSALLIFQNAVILSLSKDLCRLRDVSRRDAGRALCEVAPALPVIVMHNDIVHAKFRCGQKPNSQGSTLVAPKSRANLAEQFVGESGRSKQARIDALWRKKRRTASTPFEPGKLRSIGFLKSSEDQAERRHYFTPSPPAERLSWKKPSSIQRQAVGLGDDLALEIRKTILRILAHPEAWAKFQAHASLPERIGFLMALSIRFVVIILDRCDHALHRSRLLEDDSSPNPLIADGKRYNDRLQFSCARKKGGSDVAHNFDVGSFLDLDATGLLRSSPSISLPASARRTVAEA